MLPDGEPSVPDGEPSVPNGELSVPNGELHVVDDVPAAFVDLVVRQVGIELADRSRVRDEPFSLVLSGGSTARELLRTAGPQNRARLGPHRVPRR